MAVAAEPTLLSTAEVARRLGVKRETVYAYVSRGLLERHPASGHRASRFDAEAVERLAAGARHGDRSAALEVVIETQLTSLDPAGRLHFRGHDAVGLARFRTFEDVAALLWDGDAGAPWRLSAADAALVAAVQAPLPADAPATDVIPVVLAALGAADPGRADRRPDPVRRAGARMLAGALVAVGAPAAPADGRAAERLLGALRPGTGHARPAEVAAIDAALVLMADHELAASTFATRVAASAWADPYRAVLAGLAPLGGTLHAGASRACQELLGRVRTPVDAFAVLDEARERGGGSVPGFGHRVYRGGDPRAEHLLGRVASVAHEPGDARRIGAVLEAAGALGLPAPNADLGLAALGDVMRLRPGAAATIFHVARIAGLVAHALEEYPHRLRFRPRATYVGPAPRG
jgi:citrate synthase